ncbi:malate synthase A [Desulfatitalea alkaliphila]|uniref:Malate synthase n=1 Tax=Desulfatitalea alkaliphila TaxID=2929485 RepID=A0AA41R703_9BACT|nr:malate synthase A [Desulfatitalea alkaliphila]MCJ8502091.1 malate synthase A [Desulfatitalea alkaliphila]
MPVYKQVDDIEVVGPPGAGFETLLTDDALRFVADLQRRFDATRKALLQARQSRQAAIDAGQLPDFLPETRHIREGDWRIGTVPPDLQDRRVEITGPVDRKMVINALNSGASAFMADFEDAHAPTWQGTIDGQINLMDAVRGTIALTTPEGKQYSLNERTAVLLVRPRGWHLDEKHLRVAGQPVSGALFDFGLFFYHNAKEQLARGTGPYFYLPKLESHLEARLWNDIFVQAQQALGLPVGTIKVTVLIETILAAFETDEILYELRDHIVGLNCGRWDYIFSFIKRFRNVPGYIFPDRALITMTRHCMRSYALRVIQTCHRRGAHAMGGMAAQIPIKEDAQANAAALDKVREDKVREARDGHDGTWVAHPGLVAIAREEFDKAMPAANQVDRLRDDVTITAADLLKVPNGPITENGLRNNIAVGIQYMAHWLAGNGCVPLYNLMEDAATAEIARAQVWQWVHHPEGVLDDGREVTLPLVRRIMDEEMDRLRETLGPDGFGAVPHDRARRLFEEIIANPVFEEFLTLKAYEKL